MSQRLKFHRSDKWYMHKPKSLLQNEMLKILSDHPIPTRRPFLVLINKIRTCHLLDFAVSADCRGKGKKDEKLERYLNLARERKKWWNMKVTMISTVVEAQWLGKGTGWTWDSRKIWKHLDYSTATILRRVLKWKITNLVVGWKTQKE